jgi:phosphoribosylanthranilate isomerase
VKSASHNSDEWLKIHGISRLKTQKFSFPMTDNLLFSQKLPAYLSAGKLVKRIMSLKTFVKINRVTNLTDARYCAGMNADVIGFSVEPDSPHHISPAQFGEITGWISGIDFAAEFKNTPSEEIKEVLIKYQGITWVESEQLEALFGLENQGLNLLYKQPIEEIDRIERELGSELKTHSIAVHLTSETGSLDDEKLAQVKTLSGYCKVILGFGITSENAVELSAYPGISGFALDSGDEIKPGLRDFDQLADILEILEVEN